jgi:hypothetical protein
MRCVAGVVLLGAVTAAPRVVVAQDTRLADRLPAAALAGVTAVLDSAQSVGLPLEPLVDRALEGASKSAAADRIVLAVGRYAHELGVARDALGAGATEAEVIAGASAIRAGARPADLHDLRARRGGQSVTVAAGMMADLMVLGVPSETAVGIVLTAADRVDDRALLAFRESVERDIELGASPIAAANVRSEMLGVYTTDVVPQAPSSGRPPGPRKP